MATSTVPLGGVPGAQNGIIGAQQGLTPAGAVPISTGNPGTSTATATALNPIGVTQANPYAPPSSTGSVPTGTSQPVVDGGVVQSPAPASSNAPANNNPSGVQNNGVNWNDGSNTVTGDLKDTYGAGTGTAVSNVLQNMGTVNDSAIQATIANTDLAANNQYGNIQAQEAAGGVTPNSSTAALASGDFYSQVNSQLQQTIGQEEVGEENTLLGTLTNEGQQHGPDESTFDSVLGGITDAGILGGAGAGLAGLF